MPTLARHMSRLDGPGRPERVLISVGVSPRLTLPGSVPRARHQDDRTRTHQSLQGMHGEPLEATEDELRGSLQEVDEGA